MNDHLYRSRDDRILAGVAGGVAENFGLDPSLVRIVWVILTPLTGGLALLLYIIMAFIVPEEAASDARWAAWSQPASSQPAWSQPAAGGGDPAPAAAADTMAAAGASAPTATEAAPAGTGASGSAAGDAAVTGDAALTRDAALTGGVGFAAVNLAGGTTDSPMPGAVNPAPAGSSGFTASGMPEPPVAPTPPMSPSDPRSQRQAARDARRDARDARRTARHRDGTGAVIFGLLLVIVGSFFLARAYFPNLDADRIWPILLVAIGVLLVIGSIRRSSPPPVQ